MLTILFKAGILTPFLPRKNEMIISSLSKLYFAMMSIYVHYSYNGWLAGYQMSFDTSKSKLTKNNFAVGYNGGDFILHTNCVSLVKINCNSVHIQYYKIFFVEA